MIDIAPGVGISEHEVTFTFTRSPGPGGQNANKVNTRVTLCFDVEATTSLTASQRAHVKKKLATRISQEGMLKIVSSKERTQLANRRAALNRFIELMTEAFDTPKPRKKTTPPASADKKRLEDKAHRGTVKRTRQTGVSVDE